MGSRPRMLRACRRLPTSTLLIAWIAVGLLAPIRAMAPFVAEARDRQLVDTSTETATPSATGTATSTSSETSIPAASASATSSSTGSSTATPSSTPSETSSLSATTSITASESGSVSMTQTSSVSESVSGSATASSSVTASESPSLTATASVTATSSSSVTGSPSETPSLTATASVTATSSSSVTVSPTMSPSASISGSATASSSVTESESPSVTTTASITATPSSSVTSSLTQTPSSSASGSATESTSVTVSETPSSSVSPSSSASASVTASATASPSTTVTPSPTATPSNSVTGSLTASTSVTVSETPSSSTSPSSSASVSVTASVSPTESTSVSVTTTSSASLSVSPSVSPSSSETASSSVSPSTSASPSASVSPSLTTTLTLTPTTTSTMTETATGSQTSSISYSPTETQTSSSTSTGTATITASATQTPTSTSTPTITQSVDPSPTSTATSSLTVTPTRFVAAVPLPRLSVTTAEVTAGGSPFYFLVAPQQLSLGPYLWYRVDLSVTGNAAPALRIVPSTLIWAPDNITLPITVAVYGSVDLSITADTSTGYASGSIYVNASYDAAPKSLASGMYLPVRLFSTAATPAVGVTAVQLAAAVEGAPFEYNLYLLAKPTASVIVSLAISGSGNLVFDPPLHGTTRVFAVANWTTAHTVRSSVRLLSGAVAPSVSTFSITHSLSSSDSTFRSGSIAFYPQASVAVDVLDMRQLRAIIWPSQAVVMEGSSTAASLYVRLSSKPAADVSVSITVTALNSSLPALQVSPASLLFNMSAPDAATAWSSGLAVNFSCVGDGIAMGDRLFQVDFALSSTDSAVIAAAQSTSDPDSLRASVRVVDDDFPGVALSAAALQASDSTVTAATALAQRTLSVSLTSAPLAPVKLHFDMGSGQPLLPSGTAAAAAALAVAPVPIVTSTLLGLSGNSTSLLLDASNYSAGATVQVAPAGHSVATGHATYSLSVWSESSDSVYSAPAGNNGDGLSRVRIGPSANLSFTVLDSTVAGIALNRLTLFLALGVTSSAAFDSYSASLLSQPTSDVRITFAAVRARDGATLSNVLVTSPSSLLFTPSNWSVSALVKVSVGVAAASSEWASGVSLVHTAVSADPQYDSASVAATAAAAASGGLSSALLPLISPLSRAGSLFTPSSAMSVVFTGGVLPAILLSASRTAAVIEGGSYIFTATLSAEPNGTVTLDVSGASRLPTGYGIVAQSGLASATISPTTVTFTRSNWSTPALITVTAGNDNYAASYVLAAASTSPTATATPSPGATAASVLAGAAPTSVSRYFDVTFKASSPADSRFDGDVAFVPGSTVALEIFPDDAPAVLLSTTLLTTSPGAGAVNYSVGLSVAPTSAVVVKTRLPAAYASSLAVLPSVLWFGPSNWSTPQTVFVAAVTPTGGALPVTNITVLHDVTVDPLDAQYAYGAPLLPSNGLTVRVIRASVPTIVLSQTPLYASEGGGVNGSYTISLTAVPQSQVVVTVDAVSGTLEPARLRMNGQSLPYAVTFAAGASASLTASLTFAALASSSGASTSAYEILLQHTAASSDVWFDSSSSASFAPVGGVIQAIMTVASLAACVPARSCAAGYVGEYSGATFTCRPCRAGYYCTGGCDNEVACAAGTGSFAGASACQQSPVGYGLVGSVFVECPDGYFSATVGGSCLACPAYTVSYKSYCAWCEVGRYAYGTTCNVCTAATTNATSSSAAFPTACLVCPPGYKVDTTQAIGSHCIACGTGEYSTGRTSSCSTCPSAFYNAKSGVGFCYACEPGTDSASNGAACAACPSSSAYINASSGVTSCSQCGGGSVPNSGFGDCVACAAGFYEDLTTVTHATSCTACGVGRYLADPGEEKPSGGSDPCNACPKGYFTPLTGQTACQPCPSGTYTSSDGATACVRCTGVVDQNDGSCKTCNAGERPLWDPVSSTAYCIANGACPSGYEQSQVYPFDCVPCSPGYESPSGGSSCSACAAGKYAPTTGAINCEACPSGFYAAGAGASVCLPSPVGLYANANGLGTVTCQAGNYLAIAAAEATDCTACRAGTYSSVVGVTACDACTGATVSDGTTACAAGAAGTVPSLGHSTTQSCPTGYYAPAGAVGCSACEPGTYWTQTLATSCTVCSAGYHSPVGGASSCTACVAGYYAAASNASVCTACAAGTFSASDGASSCTPCADNSVAIASGATSCLACPAGKAASANKTSCDPCAAGRYDAGNGVCTPCGAGNSSAAGATACTNCGVGRASNASVTAGTCPVCSAGRYAAILGMTVCDLCPPRFIRPISISLAASTDAEQAAAAVACVECSPGWLANDARTACVPCPAGSIQVGTTCVNCTAGSSTNGLTGQTECTTCPAGRYAGVDAVPDCTVCPGSAIAPSPGTTDCAFCPPGHGVVDFLSCAACPAGRANNGSTPTCGVCPPGFASLDVAENCSPCMAGLFTAGWGSTSCDTCGNGTFSLPGAAICTPCSAGQWSYAGSGFCVTASPGYIPNVWASRAYEVPCPAGHGPSGDLCIACTNNTYSSGGSPCTQCPFGTIVNALRSGCDSCAPGFYHASPNATSCSITPAGSFTELAGSILTDITVCPPGSYGPAPGASACIVCGNGTAVATSNATACVACASRTVRSFPAGTNLTGVSVWRNYAALALSCTACQSGQVAVDSETCTACPAGRFQLGNSCVRCWGNTYSGPAATSCMACYDSSAPGPLGGAIAVNESSGCASCTPGYFLGTGDDTTCTACPVGRFSNATGTVGGCDKCPIGTSQSSPGASYCPVCASGSFAAFEGQTQCDRCPAHFYRVNNGTFTYSTIFGNSSDVYINGTSGYWVNATDGTLLNITDISLLNSTDVAWVNGTDGSWISGGNVSIIVATFLDQNMWVNDGASCTSCPNGTVSDALRTSCVQCEPGTYQEGDVDSCSTCQGNTFADSYGMSTCAVCPFGTVTAGGTSCRDCTTGFFKPTLAHNVTSTCFKCPTGRTSTPAATSCGDCPPGYAATGGSTTCNACAAGKASRSMAGIMICENCPDGRYSAEAASECTTCPPGARSNPTHTNCTACPGGYYKSASENECSRCSGNTYSDPGSIGCTDCPIPLVSAASFTRCDPCAAGRSANTSTGQCIACGLGYYAPTGYWAQPGQTVCLPTVPGEYAPRQKMGAPELCPAGRYSNGTALSTCLACGPGTFSTLGSRNCTKCDPGYVATRASGSCSACLPGTYAALRGMSICLNCRSGTYSPDVNSTFCSPCASGYSQSLPGMSTCSACEPGTYSTRISNILGSDICTACSPGKFMGDRNATSCLSCAVMGSRFYQQRSGMTTCDLCPNGTDAGPDRTLCTDCPLGKYQVGAGPCTNCSAGFVALVFGGSTRVTSCTSCLPGYISPEMSATCTACPAGKFAASYSSSVCLDCALGLFSGVAASSCAACGPGFYANATGSSGCFRAPVGTYVPLPQASFALPCPAGRFQPAEAQPNCTACPRGRYQPLVRQTTCVVAKPGFGVNVTGSTRELPCAPGKFNAGFEAWQCDYCAGGTIAPDANATSCSTCPAGFYSPPYQDSGKFATSCLQCPGNSYSDQPGVSNCTDCPAGTIVSTEEPSIPPYTTCLRCVANEYRNGTRCIPCGEGQYSYTPEIWEAIQASLPAADRQPRPTDFQERCDQCQPGRIAAEITLPVFGNVRTCVACSGRSIQPKSGQARCSACEPGTYAYPPGRQTVCEKCKPGRYLDPDGVSNRCLQCEPGFFNPDGALPTCLACPAGKFQNEFSVRDSCEQCPAGSVKSNDGAGSCYECGIGEVSSTNNTRCIPCNPATSVFDCSQRQLIIPPTGTWFANSLTDPFSLVTSGGSTEAAPLYTCLRPAACLNQMNESSGANTTVCAPGHEGVLCAICSDGYALGADNVCRQCQGAERQLLTSLGIAFGVIILAVIVARRDKSDKSSAQFAAVFRIALGYAQTLALLGSFGGRAIAIIKENLVFLDFTADPATRAFSPLQCLLGWRFQETFYAIIALPLVLTLLVLIINGSLYLVRRVLPPSAVGNRNSDELWREFQYKSVQSVALITLLIYLNVVTYIFRASDFYKPAIMGEEYLRWDFRLTFSSPAYKRLQAAAWVAGAFYMLVIPVSLFLYLWRNQFKLETPPVREKLKLMYDGLRYVGSTNWEERMADRQERVAQSDFSRRVVEAEGLLRRARLLQGEAAYTARGRDALSIAQEPAIGVEEVADLLQPDARDQAPALAAQVHRRFGAEAGLRMSADGSPMEQQAQAIAFMHATYDRLGLSEAEFRQRVRELGLRYEFGRVRDANGRPMRPVVLKRMMEAYRDRVPAKFANSVTGSAVEAAAATGVLLDIDADDGAGDEDGPGLPQRLRRGRFRARVRNEEVMTRMYRGAETGRGAASTIVHVDTSVVVRNHIPGEEDRAVRRFYGSRDRSRLRTAALSPAAADAVPEAKWQFGQDSRLFRDLPVGTWWYEIVNLYRKVFVAGIAIGFSADLSMQCFLGFYLFLIVSVVHLMWMPYDEGEVNFMETLTLVALTLTNLLSLLQQNLVFESTFWYDVLTAVMFIMNAIVLATLLMYIILDLMRTVIVPFFAYRCGLRCERHPRSCGYRCVRRPGAHGAGSEACACALGSCHCRCCARKPRKPAPGSAALGDAAGQAKDKDAKAKASKAGKDKGKDKEGKDDKGKASGKVSGSGAVVVAVQGSAPLTDAGKAKAGTKGGKGAQAAAAGSGKPTVTAAGSRAAAGGTNLLDRKDPSLDIADWRGLIITPTTMRRALIRNRDPRKQAQAQALAMQSGKVPAAAAAAAAGGGVPPSALALDISPAAAAAAGGKGADAAAPGADGRAHAHGHHHHHHHHHKKPSPHVTAAAAALLTGGRADAEIRLLGEDRGIGVGGMGMPASELARATAEAVARLPPMRRAAETTGGAAAARSLLAVDADPHAPRTVRLPEEPPEASLLSSDMRVGPMVIMLREELRSWVSGGTRPQLRITRTTFEELTRAQQVAGAARKRALKRRVLRNIVTAAEAERAADRALALADAAPADTAADADAAGSAADKPVSLVAPGAAAAAAATGPPPETAALVAAAAAAIAEPRSLFPPRAAAAARPLPRSAAPAAGGAAAVGAGAAAGDLDAAPSTGSGSRASATRSGSVAGTSIGSGSAGSRSQTSRASVTSLGIGPAASLAAAGDSSALAIGPATALAAGLAARLPAPLIEAAHADEEDADEDGETAEAQLVDVDVEVGGAEADDEDPEAHRGPATDTSVASATAISVAALPHVPPAAAAAPAVAAPSILLPHRHDAGEEEFGYASDDGED